MNYDVQHSAYQTYGYQVIRQYFTKDELDALRTVILNFHQRWIEENKDFYHTRAVNSAYLTDTLYLEDKQRMQLFEFISSSKVISAAQHVFERPFAFMGTQLFFNPHNNQQQNYWHRDPQYHLNEAEQKAALSGPEVVHIRIPLFDEPGIELVPKSHKNWDTEEELNVRFERNGHKNSEQLSSGKAISLGAGDALLFSANMIHRGLYGGQRLAFDILFCDVEPHLLEFAKRSILPSPAMLDILADPAVFKNTLAYIK
ncbi:phytanoyl-CoA dioxygenase family protein [Thalassotalea atypica]|uniref:phytanoyl-CoA dioxygenase family protein n=1 Tax=Thalassotalea atypica TaxID=2054316 RepID=UPI0025748E45|nr:phytanoyl-CoA dioxygenase family protein [Thalassotalea atypica]